MQQDFNKFMQLPVCHKTWTTLYFVTKPQARAWYKLHPLLHTYNLHFVLFYCSYYRWFYPHSSGPLHWDSHAVAPMKMKQMKINPTHPIGVGHITFKTLYNHPWGYFMGYYFMCRGHLPSFNQLSPRQSVRHFAHDINCIFSNEMCRILIQNSLKFVLKCPIENKSVLGWVMTCLSYGFTPISRQAISEIKADLLLGHKYTSFNWWRMYASKSMIICIAILMPMVRICIGYVLTMEHTCL